MTPADRLEAAPHWTAEHADGVWHLSTALPGAPAGSVPVGTTFGPVTAEDELRGPAVVYAVPGGTVTAAEWYAGPADDAGTPFAGLVVEAVAAGPCVPHTSVPR